MHRALCAGLAAAGLFVTADTDRITAASEQSRTIAFKHIHTKETLTIQYMKDGKHIPEAMEKINWMLRDWRKDEPTEMDPELIDLVWEMHNELGSAEPINIISGYRSPTPTRCCATRSAARRARASTSSARPWT